MPRGLFLPILVLLFVSSGADGATVYVPDDYATILAVVNASPNGDTIIVRPGTNYEDEIFFQ